MEYLKIDTDGTNFSVVKGSDPEQDETLLAEIDDGECNVFRYHGNEFQILSVEPDEEGDGYDTAWETVEEEKDL